MSFYNNCCPQPDPALNILRVKTFSWVIAARIWNWTPFLHFLLLYRVSREYAGYDIKNFPMILKKTKRDDVACFLSAISWNDQFSIQLVQYCVKSPIFLSTALLRDWVSRAQAKHHWNPLLGLDFAEMKFTGAYKRKACITGKRNQTSCSLSRFTWSRDLFGFLTKLNCWPLTMGVGIRIDSSFESF